MVCGGSNSTSIRRPGYCAEPTSCEKKPAAAQSADGKGQASCPESGATAAKIIIDETIASYARPLLARFEFQDERMPPGRCAWFEEFITGSVERALLVDDRHTLRDRQFFDNYWNMFSHDLADDGVVVAVLNIVRQAYDADGKEERRGWAYSARDLVRLFLQNHGALIAIFESAIATTDAATWARYPGWFGSTKYVGHYRAIAVRFFSAVPLELPLARAPARR